MLLKQTLNELSRLSVTDPISEVRLLAGNSLAQIKQKLHYFGKEDMYDLMAEERSVARELTPEDMCAFNDHEMKTALIPLGDFAHMPTESLDDMPANRERIADFAQ